MAQRSIPQQMVPRDDDPVDDESLVMRARRGDESAYAELIARHQHRVYRAAYRITGSHEEALDVAQEVFLKAYRKLGSWQPRAPFGAWLLRLAVNRAIDHRRRVGRHLDERTVGLDAVPEPAARASTAGDAFAARREIDRRVRQALEELSPAQRTVFVLRHYEGLTLREIAPVVGCSVGSVKVHLFRAVRRLRGLLHDLEADVR